MRAFQFLFFVIVLTFSNLAFAEARLKYTDSGNLLTWKKNNLAICLSEEAKKIPSINEYFQIAINIWSPVKNFPKLRVSEQTCDIYVDYKDFTCCGSIKPIAINVLNYYEYGEIIKATITINKHYQFVMGDATKRKEIYDLPGTIAHELGHAVGLEEDPDDKESIMHDINFIGKINKRFVKSGDISAINKIYPFRW